MDFLNNPIQSVSMIQPEKTDYIFECCLIKKNKESKEILFAMSIILSLGRKNALKHKMAKKEQHYQMTVFLHNFPIKDYY